MTPVRSRPDLSVYGDIHSTYFEDETPGTDPPDVAVEISSPSQSINDLVVKARRMLKARVRSVWMIEPVLQTITVIDANESKKTYEQDATVVDPATGIEIDLSKVFVRPPSEHEE